MNTVLVSVVVGHIIYFWGGFLSKLVELMLFPNEQSIRDLSQFYRFTSRRHNFEGLLECADYEMFMNIQRKNHCLHPILPLTRVDCSKLKTSN